MKHYLVHHKNKGFTLLEVLVSLLILAIGLLGLAALQTRGVKYNHDAYGRSQGTLLANQMMDMLRANPTNAANYVTIRKFGVVDGTACDPTKALVTDELRCWFFAVQSNLPAGDAQVVQQGATATLYDVTIYWHERGGRNPTTQATCESIAARTWDATRSLCMVNQTWTVRPS
ncbi:MAG: type IV pilus modification protein PilV [Gammaproteobacteria bacterium]|nr:type IV pilus modification protein PilV [Gammaproteobacteria bacterium]